MPDVNPMGAMPIEAANIEEAWESALRFTDAVDVDKQEPGDPVGRSGKFWETWLVRQHGGWKSLAIMTVAAPPSPGRPYYMHVAEIGGSSPKPVILGGPPPQHLVNQVEPRPDDDVEMDFRREHNVFPDKYAGIR